MPWTERSRRRWAGQGRRAAIVLGLMLASAPALAAEPGATDDGFVCARAVVALDASKSTASSAFDRQRVALAEAFRHPLLAQAVQDCLPGSIGVLAMTWSGRGVQRVCAPWTVLRSAEELAGFAEAIERCAYHGGTTDIGAAVEAALGQLERAPLESHYRVVFLLTNGLTDKGAEARLARARAVAEELGVTVAGHALLNQASFWKAPRSRHDPLRRWVEIKVTAGPRAFTSASDVGEDNAEILDALIRLLRQELH